MLDTRMYAILIKHNFPTRVQLSVLIHRLSRICWNVIH